MALVPSPVQSVTVGVKWLWSCTQCHSGQLTCRYKHTHTLWSQTFFLFFSLLLRGIFHLLGSSVDFFLFGPNPCLAASATSEAIISGDVCKNQKVGGFLVSLTICYGFAGCWNWSQLLGCIHQLGKCSERSKNIWQVRFSVDTLVNFLVALGFCIILEENQVFCSSKWWIRIHLTVFSWYLELETAAFWWFQNLPCSLRTPVFVAFWGLASYYTPSNTEGAPYHWLDTGKCCTHW